MAITIDPDMTTKIVAEQETQVIKSARKLSSSSKQKEPGPPSDIPIPAEPPVVIVSARKQPQ